MSRKACKIGHRQQQKQITLLQPPDAQVLTLKRTLEHKSATLQTTIQPQEEMQTLAAEYNEKVFKAQEATNKCYDDQK